MATRKVATMEIANFATGLQELLLVLMALKVQPSRTGFYKSLGNISIIAQILSVSNSNVLSSAVYVERELSTPEVDAAQ